jgi:ribosome recycling factor
MAVRVALAAGPMRIAAAIARSILPRSEVKSWRSLSCESYEATATRSVGTSVVRNARACCAIRSSPVQPAGVVVRLEEHDYETARRRVRTKPLRLLARHALERGRVRLRHVRRDPVDGLDDRRLAVHLHEEVGRRQAEDRQAVGAEYVRVDDDALDERLLADRALPVGRLLRERARRERDDRDDGEGESLVTPLG